MASNLKETRIQQKQRFLRLLSERKAALLAQGVNEEKIKKDRAIKHLLAEIKRTSRAITSVDARASIINDEALKSADRRIDRARPVLLAKKSSLQKGLVGPARQTAAGAGDSAPAVIAPVRVPFRRGDAPGRPP